MNNNSITRLFRALICYLVFIILLPFACFADPASKIDSLKLAINKIKSDSGIIKVLITLSESMDCNNPDNVKYTSEALQLSKKIKWDQGIILSNIQLGIIKNCLNSHSEAIEYFQQAVVYARSNNDRSNEAKALYGIAFAYKNLSQYDKALNYYRQVYALKSGTEMELGTLGNMGVIYTAIGDYTKALGCYDSSLRMLDELKKHTNNKEDIYTLQMAGLLIAIGDIYVETTQYDKALNNYSSALKLTEQVENKAFKIEALMAIGKTQHLKKNDDRAIEYYIIALNSCKEFNDKKMRRLYKASWATFILKKKIIKKPLNMRLLH